MLKVPLLGLEARPFAEWVVRSTVKLHGASLRSVEDTCFRA